MHAAIWSEMIDYDFQLPAGKPLTAASYSAGPLKRAFVEPLGVGDVLPAMPLFLEAETYVSVPLEATYLTAFEDTPKPYRAKLSPPAAGD